MRNKSESFNTKALYFVGLYYFIISIISLAIFLFNFVANLFTSVPAESTNDYVFQLIIFIFLVLLMIYNFQILSNKTQRTSVIINFIFSAFQIFSFHISHIHYFFSFGSAIGLLLGDHYGIQLQMIFQFYNNTATFKIVDETDFPFISVNLIPLTIFFIMLVSLKRMKNIENEI